MPKTYPYTSNPDGPVELDYRPGPERDVKQAVHLSTEEYDRRSRDRAGHAELDAAVEALPGLTRAARDKALATPRDQLAPLGHPLKERRAPAGGQRRLMMSGRQRDERSKVKHHVQDQMSGTAYREMRRLLVDDPNRWDELNDSLSKAAGDVQQLPEREIQAVQRIDRTIQSYEAVNDRSHVVYTNVRMPGHVKGHELGQFTRDNFPPGSDVAFDRYSMGAHDPHEVEPYDTRGVVLLEIETRRGMYLGQSSSGHDTSHLLPRGLRLRVQEITRATYQRPGGTIGQRTIVRLTDAIADRGEGTE